MRSTLQPLFEPEVDTLPLAPSRAWWPWARPRSTPRRPAPDAAPRAAQPEAERRRRLAAAASLTLSHPLNHARHALHRAAQAFDAAAPGGGRDAVQAGLDEALQRCEQLALLTDHLQRLLAPASPTPRRFDLASAVSQALCCARLVLPAGIVFIERFGPLPPVQGERAEIVQAVIDGVAQLGHHLGAAGHLVLEADQQADLVLLDLLAVGERAVARFDFALESAIDTLARHQGTLELSRLASRTVRLRIRLPAAR